MIECTCTCLCTIVGSRNYDKTNANERSSRSHTIFKITIESRLVSDQEESDGTIRVASLVRYLPSAYNVHLMLHGRRTLIVTCTLIKTLIDYGFVLRHEYSPIFKGIAPSSFNSFINSVHTHRQFDHWQLIELFDDWITSSCVLFPSTLT